MSRVIWVPRVWIPLVLLVLAFVGSVYAVASRPSGHEPFGVPVDDAELLAAVEDYFDAYADARVSCEIERLWERHPRLATGMIREKGINDESVGIDLCLLAGMEFELERYEPMLVRHDGHAREVRIHGLEWWDYRDGSRGGGEFIITLRFERIDGSLQLTQSDEVTIVEYHEGHY